MIRAQRRVMRSKRGRALLVLEMDVLEAAARFADLPLGTYAAAALVAGDRLCEHGVSILATGARACVRCSPDRRSTASELVRLANR